MAAFTQTCTSSWLHMTEAALPDLGLPDPGRHVVDNVHTVSRESLLAGTQMLMFWQPSFNLKL